MFSVSNKHLRGAQLSRKCVTNIGFLRARSLANEIRQLLEIPVRDAATDVQVRALIDAILSATGRAFPVDDAAARVLRALEGKEFNRAGEPMQVGATTGLLAIAVEAARDAWETGEQVPRVGQPLFPSTITPEEAAADPMVVSLDSLRRMRDTE
jgi:hypothetical protein